MVTGESLDAISDAIQNPATPVSPLYYTCLLNTALIAAGAPDIILPKDCVADGIDVEMAPVAELLAERYAFEDEILEEASEELGAGGPEGLASRRGDAILRAILQEVAGPDVAWYVTFDGLRAPVLNYVKATVKELSDPYVLVAHSLGSIVGYESIVIGIEPLPVAFVTVGSPLAWKTIRKRVPIPPAQFPQWINIYDKHDWANKRRPLHPENYPPIDNLEVDNPPVDGVHDLYGYLTHPAARDRLARLVSA